MCLTSRMTSLCSTSSSMTLVWWPPIITEDGPVIIIHCMFCIFGALKTYEISILIVFVSQQCLYMYLNQINQSCTSSEIPFKVFFTNHSVFYTFTCLNTSARNTCINNWYIILPIGLKSDLWSAPKNLILLEFD